LILKRFRDPIHGLFEVSNCALDIIDTTYFQRLRRVRQLAFSNLVYHGAEHSRYGHCIGVYYLAERFAKHLLPEGKPLIKEEFCLAGLLHDIGHHPYSHAFESVLRATYEDDEDTYHHESITTKILESTEIADIIEAHGFSVENVSNLIKGQYTEEPDFQFLNALISSELDIDRLDYLVRDSYYCGVPYGHIDIDRLIFAIESIDNRIIISSKGLQSAEMYVLARFYMYTSVYFHKTTRAFDIMLGSVFNKDILDEKISQIDVTDPDQFKHYDDQWLFDLLRYISTDGEGVSKELAQMIINRDPIRCIIEKYSLTDRSSENKDPDYVRLDTMSTRLGDVAAKAGVNEDYIFYDEPLSNLPMTNRYSPYFSANSADGGEGAPQDRLILVNTREGPCDIARLPYSIANGISKQEAHVFRYYTLNSYRKKMCDAIRDLWPEVEHLLWYDKIN